MSVQKIFRHVVQWGIFRLKLEIELYRLSTSFTTLLAFFALLLFLRFSYFGEWVVDQSYARFWEADELRFT
jgi:hypothetical protein